MTLLTSSLFVSADGTGDDWREAVKAVLDQMEDVLRDKRAGYTIGFLYISDLLKDDVSSILTLLKSVTGVEHWIGCTGIGVCSCDSEYFDRPAISLMLGKIPQESFRTFLQEDLTDRGKNPELFRWMQENETMLALVHGDPESELDSAPRLESLQREVPGFVAGGISSSRDESLAIADEVVSGEFCGAVFSSSVTVASALSQGCSPMGKPHVITRTEDASRIIELDNQRAMEVFAGDLRQMAHEKTGHDPDKIVVDEDVLEDPEGVPGEFEGVLQGQVHVAFPVTGTDQNDYIVRDIIGADPDFGHLHIDHHVSSGDRMMFVHRNSSTIRADLSRSLVALRKRVMAEHGEFAPKGAVFISCMARAFSATEEDPLEEVRLIREIIGDVPITGFYAAGEISNSRHYRYTGVLILFL